MPNKMVNSKVTDFSATLEDKPLGNTLKIQNWLNNSEIKYEDQTYINNMIYSWKINNLQIKVEKFTLPRLETINSWSLEMTLAYEAMLVDILDKIPSNLIIAVEILLHLKIIANNQIHKFRIFE